MTDNIWAILLILSIWCSASPSPAQSYPSPDRPPDVTARAGPEDPYLPGGSWQADLRPESRAGEFSFEPPAAQASFSSGLSEPLVEEDEAAYSTGRTRPGRPGVFQKVSFTATWLDRSKLNSFGASELELYGVFAFPLPTRESPLLITPGFNVRFLDGPPAPNDMPGQVYDAYVQFRWLRKLRDRWGLDLAVSPGIYGDFQADGDELLRIAGRGLLSYDWAADVKLVGGVLYLDREDYPILPAGGVIWTPVDTVRYEFVFPRPKFAHRIFSDGFTDDWWYVAGELGGGSWLIERADGTEDQLTLRDWRVIVGLERKAPGHLGWLLEVGWVFGRRIEYTGPTPDAKMPSVAMIRGGITY